MRGVCGVWHSEASDPVLNSHAVNGSHHPHVPLSSHYKRQFSVLSSAQQLKKLHWEEYYLHTKLNIHLGLGFFFGQSSVLWWPGCYIKTYIRIQHNSIFLWAFYIENSVPILKHCHNFGSFDRKGTKRHSFGSSKYESSHMLEGRHSYSKDSKNTEASALACTPSILAHSQLLTELQTPLCLPPLKKSIPAE